MRLNVIYKAGGLIEAESLRAALFDAGIESQLDGHPSAAMPGIVSGWNMAQVGIVVDEKDLERARAVVIEWQASLPQISRPASEFRFQFSLSTLLIVMTVSAVICGIAYHLVAHLAFVIVVGTIGELLPLALMTAGSLRKRRRQLEDDSTADDDELNEFTAANVNHP